MQCSACTVAKYGFASIPLFGMVVDGIQRKEILDISERFLQMPTKQNLINYNSDLLHERNLCIISLLRDSLSVVALITLMSLSILAPAAAIGVIVVLVLSICFNAEALSRVVPLQKTIEDRFLN